VPPVGPRHAIAAARRAVRAPSAPVVGATPGHAARTAGTRKDGAGAGIVPRARPLDP
jgi:hypothetical protein